MKFPWRKRERVLIVLVLAGFLLVLASVSLLTDGGALSVKVVRLKRGEMLITIPATSTGRVESEVEVKVKAEVPGRIARLLADEGDRVKAGQILAILDQEEVRAQVGLARTNLQAARARLAQAEAGVQMLKAQVQTRISETLATLEKARKSLERARDLFTQGAISREALDLTKAEHDVAQAAYEAALASRDQLAVKEREIEVARAEVKRMEASLRLEEVRLTKTVIVSPIDGLVIKRQASEGETIGLGSGPLFTLGEAMFTIVDPSRYYISASVDEFDASKVRIGLPARVTLDAVPGRIFRGKVSKVSPAIAGAGQEARTLSIRVTLEEGREHLKPGMSADVEVIVSSLPGVLFLPTQAILRREGQSFVYLVKDGRVEQKPVVTGASNWNETEIKGGVEEGALVILTPDVPGLRDGVRVKAIEVKGGP